MKDSHSGHRTKIVCTLGPATDSVEAMRHLILAGADCFRINLSHGTRETHAALIQRARHASEALGRNIALLLDLRGAKIRTTTSSPDPFALRAGDDVEIKGGEEPSTDRRLHITPAAALQNLSAGNRILIDDGKIELETLAGHGNAWNCRVNVGGSVGSRRGVTLVDVPTRQLPGLTEKDISDIEFGIRHDVDLFALSFVRSVEDVVAAKKAVAGFGADMPIIAKLEKPEALSHLDGILQHSFGVMVARGDLGVEAPLEKVPVFQKQIIGAAHRWKKPVITATEMLESMVGRPSPTRAEVSDVANAVFDGTDAVMLSAETSIGKYPVEAVDMMARTIVEAEAGRPRDYKPGVFPAAKTTFADAIGTAGCVAAKSVAARCIVVYTSSGFSAALIAACRPSMPIYAFSNQDSVVRRMALFWGVEGRKIEGPPASLQDLILQCEAMLLAAKRVEPHDTVVVVAGLPFQEAGNTNMLKLYRIGEYNPGLSGSGETFQ